MNAILTAAVIGTALLALAIWIEIRERRVEPGDGSYRSSGPPRALRGLDAGRAHERGPGHVSPRDPVVIPGEVRRACAPIC